MQQTTMKWQSFDCKADPVPPDTRAASRPSARARGFDPAAPYHPSSLQFFDCAMVNVPDHTLAVPRPEGKERRLSVAEPGVERGPVEQKVVSILLDSHSVPGKKAPPKVEYFGEYLSEGWQVKQLTSISTGGGCGWIVVLLEREPNHSLLQAAAGMLRVRKGDTQD